MTVPTRTFRGTPRNLALLAARLRAGEVVAAPTETVYGLAGNAFDTTACRRIFSAKRRPANDPLIVHLLSAAQLPLVCTPNPAALKLAQAFWPGPLTMVLPKTAAVPTIVTAGGESVAVRVPAHPIFRELLKRAGVPLAAPSANPFGYVSPTTAAHVRNGLGGRIRYILDGGPTSVGVESTIVDLRDAKRPTILRPGAVTRAQIERVLGVKVAIAKRATPAHDAGAQVAPGMLTRHYSPRTRVILHERLDPSLVEPGRKAFVFFRRPTGTRSRNVFWLDERGRLAPAARALFATLRKLDGAGFSELHVELAPGDGLADAINDRLRRAAAR